MAYPTQDDLLHARPLEEWIDEHFLRPDPAAFASRTFRPTVSLVSRLLEVDANGVFCVGSGAIGFSINPSKIVDGCLKRYDDQSDIDLALVSSYHFEIAWRDLRRAAQPLLRSEMEAGLREHLNWQRKRIFDGVVIANKVLPYLSFGSSWIPRLTEVAEHVNLSLERSVAINAWIFRDYWGLRTYITGSVLRCREEII